MGLDVVLTNIRILMAKKDWSQSDLAAHSGVRRGTISDVLNSKKDPSIGTLIKLAKAFGVGLGTVLDGVETRSSEETADYERLKALEARILKFGGKGLLDALSQLNEVNADSYRAIAGLAPLTPELALSEKSASYLERPAIPTAKKKAD